MNKARFLGFLVLLATVCLAGPVLAQKPKAGSSGPMIADFSTEPSESNRAEGGIVQLEDLPPDVPVEDFVEGTPQSKRQYIYERPTLKNLANLFWAIGYADLSNDEHINHYLRVTECEIYRKFISSEFEMKEIREATRKFIVENRNDFSTRFELVQQISLRDYDIKRRAFKINLRHQIQSVRRFELISSDDINQAVCGQKARVDSAFPPGLILEFSRPFTLTYIPVPVDIALSYIEQMDMKFQKLLDKSKSQERVYDYRKAYLVLYAKAFAFRKLESSTTVRGAKLLQTMAVLEGVEVYGDPGRKQLFFSKSFLSNKSPTEVTENLRKEYAILREKYEGEGMLH